jgi:hypothetical protein
VVVVVVYTTNEVFALLQVRSSSGYPIFVSTSICSSGRFFALVTCCVNRFLPLFVSPPVFVPSDPYQCPSRNATYVYNFLAGSQNFIL